jgi:hypothetical protein
MQMWVMVSGPYRAASAEARRANLRVLNRAAHEIFRKGHVPIIGVNAALPIIEAAVEECYDDIMMPMCVRLIDRCDAVLRIGGPSEGADIEVEHFRARELPVFESIDDIPPASTSPNP